MALTLQVLPCPPCTCVSICRGQCADSGVIFGANGKDRGISQRWGLHEAEQWTLQGGFQSLGFKDWALAPAPSSWSETLRQARFVRGWGWRTDPRFFWTGLFGRRPPARADSRDTFGTHPDEANWLQQLSPQTSTTTTMFGAFRFTNPLSGGLLW